MTHRIWHAVAVAAATLASSLAFAATMPSGKPEYMLVGIDNKVVFGDDGSLQLQPPGNDVVAVIDIGTDPGNPKIVAQAALMNSVVGPPTNLAITPDGTLGIVANSLDWVQDGDKWKFVPDNKLYVIDLTTDPPRLADTLAIGKQPSGLSINRAGNLALVANRADNSISVLSIEGKTVKLVDTVPMGEMVAAVVFTPDGKRALAAKFPGQQGGAAQRRRPEGDLRQEGPCPLDCGRTTSASCRMARLPSRPTTATRGRSDGSVDTVSVIDLEANPPRVIDKITSTNRRKVWR